MQSSLPAEVTGRNIKSEDTAHCAEAAKIVTMRATAGRGEVEAAGSLERHDLNRLAHHQLEGGAEPFRRRSAKLVTSIRSS